MQRQWFVTFNVRKKEKVVNFLFLILSAALSTHAYSEGEFASLPEVEMQYVAPQKLSVGDSLELVLPPSITDVKELNVPAGSSSLKDLGWRINKTADGKIRAYALRPGDVVLPSLEIKNNQDASVGRTTPLKFKVESAISDQDPKPKEPEGLRPPLGLPFPTLIAAMLVLLVLILISGLVFVFFRWKKNRAKVVEKIEPVVSAISEDQEALNKLLALEKQNWQGPGRNKVLVFSISETFKKYLSLRFNFEALESTSEEILETIEKRQLLSPAYQDDVEKIFSDLDQIKFTDIPSETEQCLLILQDVRKMILRTRRGPHEIR